MFLKYLKLQFIVSTFDSSYFIGMTFCTHYRKINTVTAFERFSIDISLAVSSLNLQHHALN